MKEKLADALSEISEKYVTEAATPPKTRKQSRLAVVAAVIALILLVQPLVAPTTASAAGMIAEPKYPDMAQYPDESQGWPKFNLEWNAWSESQQKQYDQPADFADNLTSYFRQSIPTFLAGETGENAVCSPLNIYMALAMLAETTDGDTRAQILELLNADSLGALRTQAGHVWNAHYCADGATASILANSLWLDDSIAHNQQTADTLAKKYFASVYRGQLGSVESNQALRDWLNRQTDGLLEEQAGQLQLDRRTVMVLASTVLYRVKWSNEFYEDYNTESTFHSPGGDREVTFMNSVISYGPYFWGEDFGAVYLELEDTGRMWLILPDEGITPADILESGQAMDLILGDWETYENQSGIQVNLSLPKFDVASNLELSGKLTQLGITHAFDPSEADFSAILPEDAAYLNSVQHAARVAIDEEGVTAAAYTSMLVCGAGAPLEEEIDFVLDRPFLFVITSRADLPLFAGVVNNP